MVVSRNQVAQVQQEVCIPLEIVELIDFGRIHHIALALESRGSETEAEGRRELIPEGQGSGRGKQVFEGGFAEGVGSASLDLAEPVGIEFHGWIAFALLCECSLCKQDSSKDQS